MITSIILGYVPSKGGMTKREGSFTLWVVVNSNILSFDPIITILVNNNDWLLSTTCALPSRVFDFYVNIFPNVCGFIPVILDNAYQENMLCRSAGHEME